MSIMSYTRSSANQRLGGGNALTFASLLFPSILRLHAQQTPLKVFTECSLGPQFQIVQVDGPVERFAWPSPTKAARHKFDVESGYRVLITYREVEVFGNLQVERLPATVYQKEKSDLLSSLEFFASGPGMDGKVQTGVRNGFNLYGVKPEQA